MPDKFKEYNLNCSQKVLLFSTADLTKGLFSPKVFKSVLEEMPKEHVLNHLVENSIVLRKTIDSLIGADMQIGSVQDNKPYFWESVKKDDGYVLNIYRR